MAVVHISLMPDALMAYRIGCMHANSFNLPIAQDAEREAAVKR